MKRNNVEGIVYLLHFEEPYKGTQHYIGWTEEDVVKRMREHRDGRGAKLLAHIAKVGIMFCPVRTWRGTRALERKLKNYKNAKRWCPLCDYKGTKNDTIKSQN